MSDVAKITQELVSLSKKLALASNDYTDACREAADKRSTYDVERAKELLRTKGKTVGEREAHVSIVCESVMRDARISEAMREALKERLKALTATLNATQTRASFLKAEMKFTSYET